MRQSAPSLRSRKAANAEEKIYAGLTLPLWFGLIGMVLGVILMLISRPYYKQFFARKAETAPAGLLDAPVPRGLNRTTRRCSEPSPHMSSK